MHYFLASHYHIFKIQSLVSAPEIANQRLPSAGYSLSAIAKCHELSEKIQLQILKKVIQKRQSR